MRSFILIIALIVFSPPASDIYDVADIARLQQDISGLPVGERIARWAEEFVGTPYDPDPLGEYVTRKAIVSDGRVDCMYLTFRSVELSLAGTPEEAVTVALEKRFITAGILKDGVVQNYDDRFQYAMDMLVSGKWGVEITASLAPTVSIKGSRGIDPVVMVPGENIPVAMEGLISGDIVFFVKDPQKRIVGEVIGHIGIIKREGEKVYLIHASGRKNRGGEVVKVSFESYIAEMPFVGVKVSRFSR